MQRDDLLALRERLLPALLNTGANLMSREFEGGGTNNDLAGRECEGVYAFADPMGDGKYHGTYSTSHELTGDGHYMSFDIRYISPVSTEFGAPGFRRIDRGGDKAQYCNPVPGTMFRPELRIHFRNAVQMAADGLKAYTRETTESALELD